MNHASHLTECKILGLPIRLQHIAHFIGKITDNQSDIIRDLPISMHSVSNLIGKKINNPSDIILNLPIKPPYSV